MDGFSVAEIVGLVLTAGGAAFITALIAGLRDLKSGVAAGRREVVRDLMAWRDDLDEKRKLAQADADFWRDLAGERGGQLRDRGVVPANPYPVPPSQSAEVLAAAAQAAARRRLGRHTAAAREDDES